MAVMKLGEAMVKESLITREQLKLALERQVIFGGRIGTNVVELGALKEKELAEFLSRYFRIPAVDPVQLASVDEETIACVSREAAEKYKVVPFRKDRNRLHVAMLDPRSIAEVDELRFITGYDVVPYVVSELRLLYTLEKYYGVARDIRYISIFSKDEAEAVPGKDNKEQVRKVKEAFSSAREKEEIIGILLSETKKIASRVAILILKGDTLSGWKARGITIENAQIPVEPNSVFSDVISRKNYYRGPLLKIPGNEALISILGGAPQDCLLMPIQIRDRIIALLYADNGNSAVMDASLNYINSLVAMAAYSFEIVILKNKIMEL
ncbi:MAG: hypothetical protein M0Z79_09005 [Nitrospiraceae bacterium]|nr:hypothetical protein [Nitrospiraceae bacterium]